MGRRDVESFVNAVARAKMVGVDLDDIPAPIAPLRDPILCPNHLLDRTQPSDLGYTTPDAARERWLRDHPGQECDPRHTFKTIDPHPSGLSWSPQLEVGILGWQALATVYLGGRVVDATVIPEIAHTGAMRCRNIDERGARCFRYATQGFICTNHMPYWAARKEAAMSHGYRIENTRLAELVEKHRDDPKLRDLAPEIGLLRSLLEITVAKIGAQDRLEDIDDSTKMQLIQMTRIIGEQVDRLVTIETKMNQRLSIEQLAEISMRMFEAVIEIIAPTAEQATRLANAFGRLASVPRTTSALLAEPAQVEGVVLTSPLDAHVAGGLQKAAFTVEERQYVAPRTGEVTPLDSGPQQMQRREDLIEAAKKWAPTSIPRFTR